MHSPGRLGSLRGQRSHHTPGHLQTEGYSGRRDKGGWNFARNSVIFVHRRCRVARPLRGAACWSVAEVVTPIRVLTRVVTKRHSASRRLFCTMPSVFQESHSSYMHSSHVIGRVFLAQGFCMLVVFASSRLSRLEISHILLPVEVVRTRPEYFMSRSI